MKTNDTTFEQAFQYLKDSKKELKITGVAKKIGISRSQLSASLNGTLDKRGKPNTLPKKYKEAVINYVRSLGLT